MARLVLIGLVAALGLVGVAGAQEADDETLDAPTAEAAGYAPIDLGPIGELTILPSEPSQTCLLERVERAGETAHVLVVTVDLTPHGAFASAPRWLLAVGPLEDAAVLACFGLADEAL